MTELTRFRCTECGNCCRGLRVPVTHRDVQRLAGQLGAGNLAAWLEWLSPAQVDMTGEPECFVRLREGRRLLVLGAPEGACVFLGDDQRCRVYARRPLSCRASPLRAGWGPEGRLQLQLLEGVARDGAAPVVCEYATDGLVDPAAVYRAELDERAELASYAALVQRWNLRQRSRRRLGRLPETAERFFELLLSAD